MAFILLKNCTELDGHKDNGIKHCHRADKTTRLLEPSLKVISNKFEWGATSKITGLTKNDDNENGGFFCRKLIIFASILPMFGVKIGG